MTLILVGLMVLVLSPSTAGADGDERPPQAGQDHNGPAILEDCRERFVIAPGVEDEVRRRVPDRFELRRDNQGRPLLYVTALRCQSFTVDGTSRPTISAAFAASIESPDGVACATRWPALGEVAPEAAGTCNFYILFAAYDNRDVVAWSRRGTPHVPVTYVEDLSFTQHGLDPSRLGAPFQFSAGSTPSPYEMDLTVRERPAEVPLTGTFWHQGPSGTTRVRFETDKLAFGEASGTLRTDPDSEMATMFGSDQPSPANGFPLLAGIRWNHGTLTKTLLRSSATPRPASGEREHAAATAGTEDGTHATDPVPSPPARDVGPAATDLPTTGGGTGIAALLALVALLLGRNP